MKLNFKQSIKLLTLVLVVLGAFIFLIPKTLAAAFKIDAGDTNWEIKSDGIYKEGAKLNCSDIQVGNIPSNGFLIKDSSDNKLLLIDESDIYVKTKSSFTSLVYSSSISNSFIIKDSDDDILLYVDDSGLHYKEGMCTVETEAVCNNGILEIGEACDDGNSNNNDSCLDTCELASCDDSFIWNTDGGAETCDDGFANGRECICNVGWEESCTYCSSTCEVITKTDCTCLNSDIQSPEECEWTFYPADYFGCGTGEYCSAHCRCLVDTGGSPEIPSPPPDVLK